MITEDFHLNLWRCFLLWFDLDSSTDLNRPPDLGNFGQYKKLELLLDCEKLAQHSPLHNRSDQNSGQTHQLSDCLFPDQTQDEWVCATEGRLESSQ